ncbi:MAG TPA: cytochrome c biogenesis protein CcdA [Candidatus Paceibacterota bacterium]|nr:cytochrome c biogenesis protein CcdA [Candidatus Paceibacterota bacterium]
MSDFPLLIAFFAGIVSFLSPCILPIIPGFLAYLAGESSSGGPKPSRLTIFLASLFFVIGFSSVFAILGVLLNGVLAHAAYSVQAWLSRIGGAIVIFFGLYLMGFLKIGFFEYDHKLNFKVRVRSRYLTSFLFGLAFAAGWTPCVGPVLGGILGLAASAPGEAFYLLLSYAIGLGVPFLVVGLFVAQSSRFINRYMVKIQWVNKVFGAILVAIGVLVFTQDISLIANFGFVNDLILKLKS